MSYTLAGPNVIRDSDGVVVSPCDSRTNPHFVAYVKWCEAGNSPKEVPYEMPLPVPQFVTAKQAKLALLKAGWLGKTDEEVEENAYKLFDSLQEPHRSRGRIAWRESEAFGRYTPLVIAMAAQLGKTSDHLDDVFRSAALE